MRAAIYTRYGGPERLRLAEVAPPQAQAGRMIVRVMAASVNSWDWDKLTGNLLGRIGGPFGPQHRCLGADIAGVVESVGPDVTAFRVGDRVLGDLTESGWGGFAELASADPRYFTAVPEALDFPEAATIAQAGLLAWQGLTLGGALQPGRSVLINGAGGGMGSFAVQMAKRAGAIVTAVDSAAKAGLMRELGADTVLDYRRTDFAALDARYDAVLDAMARRPMRAQLSVLNRGGRYVVAGGSVRALLATALRGQTLGREADTRCDLLFWRPDEGDMAVVAQMVASGDIRVPIDEVYPLAETARAMARIGAGESLAKLVVLPQL
ncbi:NAD(P)-dependent alcohol dehydrogenase [Devosia sp.]|uniref:NAD(P)-dependent alcohol dehydrogenase n=1 Tax=Devosia sp. TaxID=1871048 RepID=UPI003A934706